MREQKKKKKSGKIIMEEEFANYNIIFVLNKFSQLPTGGGESSMSQFCVHHFDFFFC